MNILVQLVHPAHFHYYKNAIKNWENDGHHVVVAITTKDILEELVKAAHLPYVNIMPKVTHRTNKFGQLYEMAIRDWRILQLVRKNKINILTGSSVEITHIGWLLHKPAINIGEDDAHIVKKYTNAIYPFLDVRITPQSCDNGSLTPRCIQYPGFLKLTYLHPKVFMPNADIVTRYGINIHKPYCIIRFSALKAHHDKGIRGIDSTIAMNLIRILKEKTQIYITSERPLEAELEIYRLKINPLDIHHILAYASLYIGDSQSMANEAAILGTPSIRFNDFVGTKKIGVMEELENVYSLTYGISPQEPKILYAKIKELLMMIDGCGNNSLKHTFQLRRQKMLFESINVTAFLTWFIENYPESKKQAQKADEQFWAQFI